jgi:hypothetical protein
MPHRRAGHASSRIGRRSGASLYPSRRSLSWLSFLQDALPRWTMSGSSNLHISLEARKPPIWLRQIAQARRDALRIFMIKSFAAREGTNGFPAQACNGFRLERNADEGAN